MAEPTFQYMGSTSSIVYVPTPVMTIPAAIIVAREIIVSALREWMAEIGQRAKVAVSGLGKVKTTIQMISLVILLYCNTETGITLITIGCLLLYVAAVLTIWSMCSYLKAAWAQLTAGD